LVGANLRVAKYPLFPRERRKAGVDLPHATSHYDADAADAVELEQSIEFYGFYVVVFARFQFLGAIAYHG
jgi:hypothetical protein